MQKAHQILSPALAERIVPSRLLLPVFVVLAVAAAAPVFSVQIPPLADYINHLARMRVIADLSTDPLLARFYGVNWAIIPNLVMDLIVPGLSHVLGIYSAGQVFVVLTLLLLVTGTQALNLALFRHWSPWPLMAFLFLYNNILLFGFMNYIFGMGVALWGAASWVALRDRHPLVRALASAAVALLTFVCHLFAVGVYGMVILCCEAWLLRQRAQRGRLDWRQLAVEAAVLVLPFVPLIPLMLASPTMGLAFDYYWDPSGKVDGLYFLFQNYSDLFDLSMAALVIGGVIWAAQMRFLRLHPAGWYLLGLGTLVYMLMPRMLFSSWVADQRLPVALVFVMIGFSRFESRARWPRLALYGFIAGLALARFASVQLSWQNIDRAYADFRHSVGIIAPGSTVLVANADQPSGSEAFNMSLSHAACVAMIERSSLVSTAFSVAGKQVLAVRPEFRDRVDDQDGDPPTVSQLIAATTDSSTAANHYWENWNEKFDYVYVLYTEGGADNPAPGLLTLVYEGKRFQLYKVKPVDEQNS